MLLVELCKESVSSCIDHLQYILVTKVIHLGTVKVCYIYKTKDCTLESSDFRRSFLCCSR